MRKKVEKETAASVKPLSLDPDKLYFCPLGGSEQFGVNCNLYAHDGSWLMVDLGMGFADHRMPGIDIVLPNIDFAVEHKENIRGLIVTHAHEDHIGAVAHLWPRLRCPIYCTPFTAELMRRKFQENPACAEATIQEIKAGDTLTLGPFAMEFVAMAHSIPETVGLYIQTKAGTVYHSADWNMDPNPVIGEPTDMDALTKIGQRGVDAYIGDSTNAMKPGRAGSEHEVAKGLANVIAQCGQGDKSGKILVTLFASNIGRIESIYKAAVENGRRVALIGRSLHRMVGAGRNCGYLQDIGEFVAEEDIPNIPPEKLLVIVTGSQGESRAALAKISRGNFASVQVKPGDTVIFSSKEIPGNERDIQTIKNNLAASGAHLVLSRESEDSIHISGHACRDEIIDILGALKPKGAIPVHGEHVHLLAQAELARDFGVQNICVPVNGAVIEISGQKIEMIGRVETGLLAVEPKRLVASDHLGIRERRRIQNSGVVHLSLVLGRRGGMAADPELTIIGLTDPDQPEEYQIEENLYDEIFEIYEGLSKKDLADDEILYEKMRVGIRRFVNYTLGIKPFTTIHILRV